MSTFRPQTPKELRQVLRDRTSQGWEIVSQTNTSAQLKKPKQWNKLGVLLFIVVPLLVGLLIDSCFYSVALLGLLIVVADYVIRDAEMEYISIED